MSFRIRPDASIRRNLRRLARRELDRALAAIADPEALGLHETVHDVRTRCKKVRAVLRLYRPGLGTEYRRANDDVRDAARELSPLRDARATLATFDELVAATHGERVPGEGLAGARAGLARRAHEAERDDPSPALARAERRLARVRGRLEGWAPDDDVAIVLEGLAANYRAARRAFRAARDEPGDEAFHDWRKRTKYAWHHVKLLEPVAPSALRPLGRRLKDLSDGLGDDHDLAVLAAMIRSTPADFGGDDGAREALALIDAARADLQDRCVRLGARIYAESPKALRPRVARYWSAWHDLGRERPVGKIGDLGGEPADRPPEASEALVRAASR
jgi:CHAD domain-containing protein